MLRIITNDKDIRLTIMQYNDIQNNVATLAYLCLEQDRLGNGSHIDNGKLLVYVNEKELYRIPFWLKGVGIVAYPHFMYHI